jgi:hypothetical protein
MAIPISASADCPGFRTFEQLWAVLLRRPINSFPERTKQIMEEMG